MIAATYEEHFGWAESELITLSRNEGLPSATVRGLRDEAVRLAMQVDGRPLDDAVVDAALKRFDLSDAQRPGSRSCTATWRAARRDRAAAARPGRSWRGGADEGEALASDH